MTYGMKFMALGAAIWVLAIVAAARGVESSCDVTDFGAKGDGVSYDTLAIQEAIDFCAEHGQQQKQKEDARQQPEEGNEKMNIVFFPAPGRYLTGTIFLRSGILLVISPGATVLASPLQGHYPTLRSRWYLILAENVSNVGITGSGIGTFGSDVNRNPDTINSDVKVDNSHLNAISSAFDVKTSGSKRRTMDAGIVDGQSSLFVQSFNSIKNIMVSWNQTGACYGDECRPRLVGFLDSRRIRVWNIQLHQPAYWCMHIVRSDHVSIHNVSIVGDFDTPNNDGIDIDSSNNTIIHGCHIDTGDDGICPKTTYGSLHNLTVSGCWIRTKSCAVKLGSATGYDFVGLYFNDIQVRDSHRGIGLQLRDSGSIYDVVFSNFNITTRYYDSSWWGRAEPIYVTTCPRTPDTVVGSINNVSFININAESENGIFLSGLGGGFVRNVCLKNVRVYVSRVTNYTGGLSDYRPGCQGLVEHQNSGVFIENVSSLIFESVHIHLAPSVQSLILPLDWVPATTAEDISFGDFSLILQTSLHKMKLG